MTENKLTGRELLNRYESLKWRERELNEQLLITNKRLTKILNQIQTNKIILSDIERLIPDVAKALNQEIEVQEHIYQSNK